VLSVRADADRLQKRNGSQLTSYEPFLKHGAAEQTAVAYRP
jgi:hypothetical protein